MRTKYDIAMFVPGLPFDGNTLKERSLGGSESAGLYMAKALGELGQRVKVFCNTPHSSTDDCGVEYLPIQAWTHYAKNTPHDINIAQRTPEVYSTQYASKLNLLWQHDLAQASAASMMNSTMWNIDRILVLSEFMAEQYKRITGLPASVFHQTRNGIDLGAFSPKPWEMRKRKRLVYASRPERGLDVLLRDIMPELLKYDPEFELCITTYDNKVNHLQEFYNECRTLAANLGDRVRWCEPLTKEQLYSLYGESALYVYPTPSPRFSQFAEVSCITAMECQAAGLPIVTSRRGALGETVAPGAGRLIDGAPGTEDYTRKFVTAVLETVRDGDAWRDASKAGRTAAKNMDWSAVASEWLDMFDEAIRSNNNSMDRLARHFWRQSDIVAVRELQDRGLIPEKSKDSIEHLMKPFEFAFQGREGFREQYAKIGKTHTPDVFEHIPNEPRYREMFGWMKAHDEVKSVIDYGCGLGGYAAYLSRDAAKTVVGVDIDPRTIEIAQQKSAQHGMTDVSFMVGEWDSLPESMAESFDCGVLQEVLEHVSEPWAVLEAVERTVKKDGWVYVTVPFGPWEYASYYSYPHRCHIWHFDQHDIRDMIGEKKDLSVAAMFAGDSGEFAEPQGWWIVTYRADHESIGKIDLERKIRLARPKQTVSVSMIVGGQSAEEMIGWTIKSLRHVADEFVLANCGMTDTCLAILEDLRDNKDYPIRIVPAPDPKEDGFEVARNVSMSHCRMDFVLWIDADEKLVGQRAIHKYLRSNHFNGYGIRQHHFAVDVAFNPDMPVRLFRRDKGLKFFGAIHEHPELALNEGPGPVVIVSDAHIAHVGYLNEEVRQNRFMRNWPLVKLDMERYPERILQKHFLMRDLMVLVREALRGNGNRLDEAIVGKCREVVDLYRKYFLGKPGYLNTDSLAYYSDALTVMNEGFEAEFSFAAARNNLAHGTKQNHYRFANQEDLLLELTSRMKEATKQVSAPEV